MASILTLSNHQIETAHKAINNYIMDSTEAKRNWLSKDRIYKPNKKGGLNYIELVDFLHAVRINWMHRYISLKYNDFWTSLLNLTLGVNQTTRSKIPGWGSKEFNNPIEKCQNHFLRPIIKSMKLLYKKFQMPPETGDKRFIFQPVIRNKNL